MDDVERELDLLIRRYGDLGIDDEVRRIRNAKQRHVLELDRLNEDFDRVAARRRITLEAIEKLDRTMRALIEHVVGATRQRHHEAWSPVPVLGFRAWVVEDDRLHGAWDAWELPRSTASCKRAPDRDEVPHTDGRCGPPPCGLYAVKRAEDLLDVTGWHGVRIALGLVEMSGKVVEHAKGYRAEHMEVVALGILDPRGALLIDDAEDLRSAFGGALAELDGVLPTLQPIETMCFWLEARKERMSWTSENKNA
ncbi:MAG: hypothetical protein HKN46_10510 [Acidimicrobiia bacterium]|nr:hypothetical protein [Acidimicrobiia bacterium]